MGTFDATPSPRQDVATAAGPMVSAAFLGPCPRPKQTQPELFAVRAVLGSSLVAIFAIAMYLEARPRSNVESDPHKLPAPQMAMASKSGIQAASIERIEAQQPAHTGILAPSREEASFDVEARAVACVAEAGVEVDVPQVTLHKLAGFHQPTNTVGQVSPEEQGRVDAVADHHLPTSTGTQAHSEEQTNFDAETRPVACLVESEVGVDVPGAAPPTSGDVRHAINYGTQATADEQGSFDTEFEPDACMDEFRVEAEVPRVAPHTSADFHQPTNTSSQASLGEQGGLDAQVQPSACVVDSGAGADVSPSAPDALAVCQEADLLGTRIAAPRVGVNEATTHSSDDQFAAPDERTVAPRLKRRSSLTQAAAPGGIRAVPIFGPQLSNPRVTSQKSLVRSFAPGDVGVTHKSLIQATAPGGISLDVAGLGRGQAKGVVVESCEGSPQSPTESATPRRHTAPSGAQAGSLQGGRLMQSTAASRARVSPATGSLKLPPSPNMQMGRTPATPRTLENTEMLRTLTA